MPGGAISDRGQRWRTVCNLPGSAPILSSMNVEITSGGDEFAMSHDRPSPLMAEQG